LDNTELLFNEAKERLINAQIALENERYNSYLKMLGLEVFKLI
jgi:hypothetical protein